jgi:hypothetical protein
VLLRNGQANGQEMDIFSGFYRYPVTALNDNSHPIHATNATAFAAKTPTPESNGFPLSRLISVFLKVPCVPCGKIESLHGCSFLAPLWLIKILDVPVSLIKPQ